MIDTNTNQSPIHLTSAHTIAIIGHDGPDGDAIGSMLALGGVLEQMGKKISYFANPLEKGFAFVPGIDKIQSQYIYTHYDCVVFVDFSSYDRIRSYTDGHKEYFDTATIIVIDHHLGDTPSHAISIKDDTCDSNCGRLFELMQQRDRTPYITPLVATYLYMGIATDTGNFRHEKQSVRVMGQVVELLKIGADKKLITRKLFENISIGQMMLMQRVFGRLRVDGRLASIWYTTADYADVGLDEGDSKIITSIMSLLGHPAISLIIRVKAADPIVDATGRYIQTISCSCSLRSRDDKTLVQPIAALFGGGGHAYAAGFKVSHDIRLMNDTSYHDGVQEMIEEIVRKVGVEVNG